MQLKITEPRIDSSKIVISVIGADMSRFPTDGYPALWGGMCLAATKAQKRGSLENHKREQAAAGNAYCMCPLCSKK